MLDALRRKDVEGFLVDKHVVVSSDKIIGDDTLEIGKMIDFRFNWGMKLLTRKPEMCIAVKNCIEEHANRNPFTDILFQVSNK